jgi:glycosyltransferase involved in cell wall biosynthesis
MRIVNVIQRYAPAIGGSEQWCREVLLHLGSVGHQVRVLTLNIQQEEQYWRERTDAESLLALGPLMWDANILVRRYKRSLPLHGVHHFIYQRILQDFLGVHVLGPHSAEMYGRLWNEIRDADVVFLHTLPYPHNLVAFMMAKFQGKAILIVPHFHPSHPDYERPIHYALMGLCDGVVTVTEFEKKYLASRGIPEDRIYVTGNGVHLSEYEPLNLDQFQKDLARRYDMRPDERIITFLGRKTPDKGVDHLIEAVRGMLDEMPVRLFLAGPAVKWFDDMYSQLSADDRRRIIDVGVLGHQEKVNLLHCSDLMALPSKYEAFGIVYLEAWACGIPVLGTTQGAIPSVIGEEGYLARYGDVAHLREKLREALRDPETLVNKGRAGREKVRSRFTWEKIGRAVEQAIPRVYGHQRRRKKVLIVSNAYPPNFVGGAELIAHQQAKAIQQLGYDVDVFAGDPDDHGQRHSIRVESFEGINIHRVCLHGRDYSSEFCNFHHRAVEEHFENLLDRYAPDVVHAHNLQGLSVGLLRCARQRNIKTLVTLHDFWGICLKNTLIKRPGEICKDKNQCAQCMAHFSDEHLTEIPVRMRRDYISLRLADADEMISPSRYLAGVYEGEGLGGIKVLANGVDVDRFARVAREPRGNRVRFSFIGYMGPHKGIYTILDALDRLKDRSDSFCFNFVGQGESAQNLERRVKERGWEQWVRFWGRVDNSAIESVYRQTDILVLASVWPENQPVCITEAMASRAAVIASNLGGSCELVEDEVTGRLFESGNAGDLAEKMAGFIDHPQRISEMGEAGLARISAISLVNQARLIAEEYESPARTRVPAPDAVHIACVGKRFAPDIGRAIESLPRYGTAGRRIMMADWLDEEDLRSAAVIWVTDPAASVAQVQSLLRSHVPLLVPESNEELKHFCRELQCGLFYRDGNEALACIEYFVAHPEIARAMGQNSFRAFYRMGTKKSPITIG